MKHSKFLGVLAATLCLGLGTLTACQSDPVEESGSTKHVHSAAADAAWEGDDNNHWKPCAASDKGQVDKAKHTFGEPYDVKAPTCTEAGSQKVKCTVCGREVTQTIKATGHTYAKGEDGEDVVTWTKEATCTEAGEGTKECTVCHTTTPVTKEALGHTYEQENGEDKVVWTKEATCTEAGEGTKTCTRCHESEAVTKAALGHDIVLQEGQTAEAPEGEALVRMYGCTRCDVTYFGFKATEVTAASRTHLTFTGEGEDAGASFWGRPIGNSIALDENGTSVNQTGDECVYDVDETGDFFEYVFTLTQEQVDAIGKCRLYCEASAANYLNGDFWGRDQQGTDWTRGYYIDGADEHVEKDADGNDVMIQDNTTTSRDVPSTAGVPETEADGTTAKMVKKGKAITDARYILYVDNEVKAFESMTDIPATVTKGTQKDTYVMPYTFESLKVGQNRISLRMAGGYRSTFYNFTFRHVEDEAEPETPAHVHDFSTETPVAAKGEGYVAYRTAECAEDHAKAIKVRALDGSLVGTSQLKTGGADDANYMKLKTSGDSISYKFDYTGQATSAKLYQFAYMDGWGSSGNHTATYESNGTGSASGCNFGIKWNNAEMTIDATTKATSYEDLLKNATVEVVAGSTSVSKAGMVLIGDVSLVNGDNTFTYTRNGSLNMLVKDFVIVIE